MAGDNEVLRRFLFNEPVGFYEPLDRDIPQFADPLKTIVLRFRQNIHSAAMVCSLPFAMATAAVQSRRLQALHTAELIGAHIEIEPGAPLTDDQEKAAYGSAQRRFADEIASAEGVNQLVQAVLHDLESALRDVTFSEAASELLRQSLAMTWTTLEVLVGDIVIYVLNQRPIAAAELLRAESTRKYFSQKEIIDALIERHFDGSGGMGNVLFADRHLDSLPMMKDILSVIFVGRATMLRAVAHDDLWELYQRRHLIVHQRGVVDRAYLTKTRDTFPIGSRIEINGRDLAKALLLVRDVAIEILGAAAELATDGNGD